MSGLSLSEKLFVQNGKKYAYQKDIKEFVKKAQEIILSNASPHQKLDSLRDEAGEDLI